MVFEAVDVSREGTVVTATQYTPNTRSDLKCKLGHSVYFRREHTRSDDKYKVRSHFVHHSEHESETCEVDSDSDSDTFSRTSSSSAWRSQWKRYAQWEYYDRPIKRRRADVFNPFSNTVLLFKPASVRKEQVLRWERAFEKHHLVWVFLLECSDDLVAWQNVTVLKLPWDHPLQWCSGTVYLDLNNQSNFLYRVGKLPRKHYYGHKGLTRVYPVPREEWVERHYAGVRNSGVPVDLHLHTTVLADATCTISGVLKRAFSVLESYYTGVCKHVFVHYWPVVLNVTFPLYVLCSDSQSCSYLASEGYATSDVFGVVVVTRRNYVRGLVVRGLTRYAAKRAKLRKIWYTLVELVTGKRRRVRETVLRVLRAWVWEKQKFLRKWYNLVDVVCHKEERKRALRFFREYAKKHLTHHPSCAEAYDYVKRNYTPSFSCVKLRKGDFFLFDTGTRVLEFGKHEGKTFRYVFTRDKCYVNWVLTLEDVPKDSRVYQFWIYCKVCYKHWFVY